MFSYSQENIFGNTPVQGLIPIKRTNVQESKEIINQDNATHNNVIPSKPTGSSLEVGVTEGQLSVSLTGGATYNIPIAVPPGINGIVPQISLSYNSQGGNGLAGYGWNIMGISTITRVASTKHHDNLIDGVNFDSSDRYAFDGQRLIIKSGTNGIYGSNGTIYETENYNNIRIISYGVHPNGANYGPAYFVVQYPDGSFAHYGNSNNSRSLTDWAITYWQNPQGVRISYDYVLMNNNLSISFIRYGSRLDNTPINSIFFIYKDRVREEQAFIGGQNFIRKNILSEIKVRSNNQGFRNYLLMHDVTSIGYERLTSIIERSGDNSKSFNPTIFRYENTSDDVNFNNDVAEIDLNNIRSDNSSTIQGDFNGDGNLDFILFPTTGNNAKKKYWVFTDILENSSNIGNEHNVGSFLSIFPTSWLNHNNILMPMQGWCVVQQNQNNGETSFKNYSIGFSNPINFQYERVFTFPKLSYFDSCPSLPHCGINGDLTPILQPKLNKNGNEIIINPIPIDPTPPLTPSICNEVSNVISTLNLDGTITFTWEQPTIINGISWEVCFFETINGNPPSNSDAIGTYQIVFSNTFTSQIVNLRRNYSFFIRTICSDSNGSNVTNWFGPTFIGGMTSMPGETKFINIPKEYISGDFNGDGLTDVIAIEKATGYWQKNCQTDCYTQQFVSIPGGNTYFVNLDRRLTSNFVVNSGSISISNNSKFLTADFNGDGKSDLFVFDQGLCKVFTLNANNNLVLLTSINSANINLEKPILMGDYNGDGKADFIIPKENFSPLFTKYISTGLSFEITELDLGIGEYFTGHYDGNSSVTQQIIANDFNNDGKTDLILTKCRFINTGTYNYVSQNRFVSVRYFSNNLNGFESTMFTTKLEMGLNHFPIPIALSFNNANSNKQISFISNNKILSAISPKDNSIETRLKEIILGNGLKEIISYQRLDNNNTESVFEPSTYTESYPNFDFKQISNLFVVSKIEQVALQQYKQQKFKYYGAVSNVEGLGFIGFRGFLRTNWFNEQSNIISTISKHDIQKRGAIVESYAVLGELFGNFTASNPTSFITKTKMTYEEELLPNKVYKIRNISKITHNGLEGTSNEIVTTYDDFNNPISTNSTSKKGNNIERTEIVNLEYLPPTFNPTYVLGRINKKSSTVTNENDTMTGEENYTYNTSHLVSKIQKKGHLTNFLTEENVYDIFGNILQKKIITSNLNTRITNYTYDSSGRFILTSSDIEGLVTTYTYNSFNGLLLTQTLPSNSGYPLRTTFSYDVWGKKIKETDYLGKSIHYNYGWLSIENNGYFSISTLGDDGSATYNWFDDIGRNIATGSKTINDTQNAESNISWRSKIYDVYDREIKLFEPIFSPFPNWEGLHTEKEYDNLGRVVKVIEFTGKTTAINYNGLVTSVTDGVTNAITVKNSLGQIKIKEDNGGTINYQYFANGNLKQSSFGSVIVSIEQDGWGRKTKLIDPSAGTYEYEYNEFGEIVKEISPKGVTTYVLNNFGKILQKTIIGINGDPTNSKTIYTYNQSSKLITNIRYDDFTGGYFTLYSYGYDNYKRLNFSDESGFNAYYQRATIFDNFGRPEKELYTAVNTSNNKQSSKWVKNTYKNGHHWQIIDDATSQVLWQSNKVNARGQLLSGNYGNGINVSNTFDQYGLPSQFKHEKPLAPINNTIILNNVFDTQRANLTSRYNSMFGYQESFNYDNLDRLTSWTDNEFLHHFTFTNQTNGFIASTSNVIVTNENIAAESRLKVTTNVNFGGVQRVIKNNALLGEKLQINGQLFFKNPSGSNNLVKYSIIERNPMNGMFIETNYESNTGVNFTFEHIVSQYTEISVKIVAGNNTSFIGPITFSLDNIQVIGLKESTQSYDNLGRIAENNIGSYNYTNSSKPFQNTSVDLNTAYNNYYSTRATLNVTYNAFKSPIEINEQGIERYSFDYNLNNSRSTMYYGGIQNDKLQRSLRKHYSADGIMEIKQDLINNTVEFVTFIGGDAYNAPIILKSDGTTQSYFYLHRDYLGSIVAISNQTGEIVEKRLLDAWGNLKQITDGSGNVLVKLTILDRCYTGHEHLQGVQLIHMNGRLYDPMVHRFLQPDNFVQDPFNTQNYNRYGYVLNNPLKYSDPSGEFFFTAFLVGAIVGAVAGGVAYIANAIRTGDWSWGGFAKAIIGGALIGGITGAIAPQSLFSVGSFGELAFSTFAAGYMPAIPIQIGDWTISLSPSIALGNATGVGVSLGVTYTDGDWNFSGGAGIMAYSNYNGFGANSKEFRYSALINYDDGKTGFSLGTNFWRGSAGSDGNALNQRTGLIGFHSGDFRTMYENDGGFGIKHLGLGDKGDSYRTAALNLSVGDYTAGFNLMTGKRNLDYEKKTGMSDSKGHFSKKEGITSFGRNYPRGFVKEEGNQYRLGALTFGYKGYRVGVNSEHVRHAIQDRAIHGIIRDGGFENKSWKWNGYFQYRIQNIFTSW